MNVFDKFSYNYRGSEPEIKPGTRVIVPVGNKITTGWIVDLGSQYKGKVKDIIGKINDEFCPDDLYLEFTRRVSELYFISQGMLLDYALSPKRKNNKNIFFIKHGQKYRIMEYSLSDLKRKFGKDSIDFYYKNRGEIELNSNLPKKRTQAKQSGFFIGYDRAKFYLKIVAENQQEDKSTLLIVPDYQTGRYFQTKLQQGYLYFSKERINEREKIWCKSLSSGSDLVIGGLSSLFLPLKNLNNIIVERGNSFFYKQSQYSQLNINEVAKIRAGIFNISCLTGLSCSMIDLYVNKNDQSLKDSRENKEISFNIKRLTAGEKKLPDEFLNLIRDNITKKKKVLVIVNKKKSADFLFCNKCNKLVKCSLCKGYLKVLDRKRVKCIRCSYEKKELINCLKCNQKLQILEDISVEKIKEILNNQVNRSGLITLFAEHLRDFKGSKLNISKSSITISTPVIINPFYHNLFDTIIFIRPETFIDFKEYNAAEKIFSIGSELKELVKNNGSIFIYTAFHFHYAFQLMHDENAFFAREQKYRKWFKLPPFFKVYEIEIRNRDLRKLGKKMREVYRLIKNDLHIERIYLVSRKKITKNFKGILQIHIKTGEIADYLPAGQRDITIRKI